MKVDWRTVALGLVAPRFPLTSDSLTVVVAIFGGLENKPWEAVGFYSVIAAATLLGIGIDFSPLDPIKALFWSAVINGFVAVPVMAAMMWVGSRRHQMGRFTVHPITLALGWVATIIMALAAVAMLIV